MSEQETLQHDPNTKQRIKETLYDLLYKPIQSRYQQRLENIIIKNTLASKYTHKSFIYRNEVYSCDKDRHPLRMNRLVAQLQPEMDKYIKDVSDLNRSELPYVLGFINQVLNSSNELHDYLRLLPSNVHDPIQRYIDTCTCRTKKLSDEQVLELLEKNKDSINLMQKRMALNLIL